jgi:hypothetical protein
MPGEHDYRILESVLPNDLDDLPAIDIGKTYVDDHEIRKFSPTYIDRLGAILRLNGREFFVQRELFGQRSAQIEIVVHYEYLAYLTHVRSQSIAVELTAS